MFHKEAVHKKVQLIARKSLGFKLARDLKANASEKKKNNRKATVKSKDSRDNDLLKQIERIWSVNKLQEIALCCLI